MPSIPLVMTFNEHPQSKVPLHCILPASLSMGWVVWGDSTTSVEPDGVVEGFVS